MLEEDFILDGLQELEGQAGLTSDVEMTPSDEEDPLPQAHVPVPADQSNDVAEPMMTRSRAKAANRPEGTASSSQSQVSSAEAPLGPRAPVEAETMTAGEMRQSGYFLVDKVLSHMYRNGWKFSVQWEGFGVAEATWDPPKAFIISQGQVNPVWEAYAQHVGLQGLVEKTKVQSYLTQS